MQRYLPIFKAFREPLIVLGTILLYGLLFFFQAYLWALGLILIGILVGSYRLFADLYESLRKGQYALDYIAALAILVSFITGQFLVCAVIALMISTGRNLEDYGVSQAKKSLSLLAKRIPQDVTLYEKNKPGEKIRLNKVTVGQKIIIRKGEVIPLDGNLESNNGQLDESSLTGEPYFIDKIKGDIIRSGTLNVGEPIVINVTKVEKDSTYRKIIEMVQAAQNEKAPLVRLADKYSTYFTLITLVIAAIGFNLSGGLTGALAVLVIATPCPLILATPIALLGGMNAAAKQRIIIKKLSSLESLSRATAMVFDKTGTITIGKPQVTKITLKNSAYKIPDLLSIAAAIERNSLHPIAKAIVNYATEQKAKQLTASDVKEIIGKGISAKVNNRQYVLNRAKNNTTVGIAIDLLENNKLIAVILLEDEIKESSRVSIKQLAKKLDLYIFTGDKQSEAQRIANILDSTVKVQAEMTPADKQQGIEKLQAEGKVVAMLGDGINDAPALAKADIGMVFSNEEQTAASEAADIVLLGGNFQLAQTTINISKKTVAIALQSIRWGIGLSILGMIIAAFGFIPPILGAGLQEAIDVAVILNALRASRS